LTQAEVNDTVTMDVTITGTGNLETMPDPVWTEGPEWRSFDSKATVNAQFVDGKLQGSRTYERVLLPTENGDLVLPAIEFSYFNPVTGQYETKSTEPITVQVTGDVGAGASLAPLDPGTAVPQNAATAAVNPVLRPIKSSAELSSSAASALTGQTGYWLLWVVPLLLLVGHFSWKSYQQRRLDTADLRRSKSAAGKAKKALKEAQNAGLGQEAAGPILTAYMEEKMNRPVAGLSHTQLVNLLSANGVDDDLSRRVQNCLMLSEMGRYAPAELTLKQGDLWSETAAVIDALDTNL
jgi:hypothetical protein